MEYSYKPYRDPKRFGNIKITNTYDPVIFNKFISEQDFDAAAAYAEQYKPVNTSQRLQLDTYIAQLRKEGSRLSAMTKGVDDDTKQAISFKYAIDNNLQLPGNFINSKGGSDRNSYTTEYRELMDRLGSSDKIKADRIAIRFNNEKNGTWLSRLLNIFDDKEVVDSFIENLSHNNPSLSINKANMESVLAGSGITMKRDSNGYELQIDKANPSILGILKAYSGGLDRSKTEIIGIDNNGNYIDGYSSNNLFEAMPYTSKAVTASILSLLDKADRNTEFINTRDDKNAKATSLITSDNFMSQEHAVLFQQLENHEIEPSEYNIKLDNIKNSIKGRLASSFVDKPIYMTDAENGIMHIVSGDVRDKLKDLYNIAAKDFDKNVIPRVGYVGDKYGLYVEIKPEAKPDESKSSYLVPGIKIDRNPNSQTIKFFIPDAENSEAMQALYADPRSRAMLTLNDMQDYGYETNVNYIDEYGDNHDTSIYNKGNQWYAYDYKINKEVTITPELAQLMLAKHYELNNITNVFESSIYDSQGNINPSQLNRSVSYWSERTVDWINKYYPNLNDKSKRDLGNKLLNEMLKQYGLTINK